MSVFPLPLNAVEHYMLADDSADYPRLFSLVLRMRGHVDAARLRRAVDAATERHPLLRALVEYDGDRPSRWIACVDPVYSVSERTVQPNACADRREIVRPIDLHREPGVRIIIERGDTVDALLVEFHHAATDGIGAIQFVADLLTLYVSDEHVTASQLAPLDPHRLATRDALGLTGLRRPLRWIYGTLGWLGVIEYAVQRPTPLGRSPAVVDGDRHSGYCSRTLSPSDTRSLRESTTRDGVTVNDRLVRDVFVATQHFFERHDPDRARAHQRIMVPVNLRAAGDERLPAANVVAMINIDRRPHRWTDRRRMLRVLHWELAAVKRLRLGVIFVQVLGTLQALFGSLRRFLPTDRCQATCVVSNLGVLPPGIPADLVDSVEFYPPIRPLTLAAFGAATFDGRLTLALQYDAAAIDAGDAAELLDRVVELLQSP